jgi:D-psicose/D-tagatose/L-ribulose 3-epimerase
VTLLGVSTWLWTSPIDDAGVAAFAPTIAAQGFDVIELPIESVGDWDPERTADVLAGLGLGVTTCAVMSGDRDLTTGDLATTAAAQAYLRASIDQAATVGSTVLAGPIYSPVGRVWRLDAAERAATIRRLVEALRPVVDHAGERGVRLALEPLNRYETSLLNTVEQALDVVETVDSPALGLCLDTFHLNIEERDPVAATRRAARRIAHVQACGTDRGAPGRDRFDWPGFVAALVDANYDGAVCIESFTVDNASIARAASIWRRLAPTQDALAIDGLAFLRRAFSPVPLRDAGRA